MTAQLIDQASGINFKEFERVFDQPLSRCVSSKLDEVLKGKKIIFSIDEKCMVPVDGWGTRANNYYIAPITTIRPIIDNTIVSAIDSSTIQVGETEEGSLYSVKRGIAISIGGHILMHFRVGPILFYLSEQTIRHSEFDHRLAKIVLLDSDSAKRLIRVRVERAIQLELSRHFNKSIILVDGSLRFSLFEDKNQSIKDLAESCCLNQNSVIGISKNTKLKILDSVSAPLAKIGYPAYMDVDLIVKSLVRNTIGNNLMVKFGNNNSPILRADIVTANCNKDESLAKLLGNDAIAGGYPETLRLAHHISTFTTTEVSCLRGHVLSNYDVTELASEDLRRTLLGSI